MSADKEPLKLSTLSENRTLSWKKSLKSKYLAQSPRSTTSTCRSPLQGAYRLSLRPSVSLSGANIDTSSTDVLIRLTKTLCGASSTRMTLGSLRSCPFLSKRSWQRTLETYPSLPEVSPQRADSKAKSSTRSNIQKALISKSSTTSW